MPPKPVKPDLREKQVKKKSDGEARPNEEEIVKAKKREALLFANRLFTFLLNECKLTSCLPRPLGSQKDDSPFTEDIGKGIMLSWFGLREEFNKSMKKSPELLENKEKLLHFITEYCRENDKNCMSGNVVEMSAFMLEVCFVLHDKKKPDLAISMPLYWAQLFEELFRITFFENGGWDTLHEQSVEASKMYSLLKVHKGERFIFKRAVENERTTADLKALREEANQCPDLDAFLAEKVRLTKRFLENKLDECFTNLNVSESTISSSQLKKLKKPGTKKAVKTCEWEEARVPPLPSIPIDDIPKDSSNEPETGGARRKVGRSSGSYARTRMQLRKVKEANSSGNDPLSPDQATTSKGKLKNVTSELRKDSAQVQEKDPLLPISYSSRTSKNSPTQPEKSSDKKLVHGKSCGAEKEIQHGGSSGSSSSTDHFSRSKCFSKSGTSKFAKLKGSRY